MQEKKMKHSTPFFIVDVFAENKYEGNQLAVIRGGARFSDDQMQKIAREMNYSETTFIISEAAQEVGYAVRIFTPKEEIPFAGHPTLGTAYIIRKEIIREQVSQVVLNLKAGQIPVDFDDQNGEDGYLWMTQLPPIFGDTFEAGPLSAMLNLDPANFDARFPIQIISTGTPFILAPLTSLSAIKRARLNLERYFEFIADLPAKAVLIFAPETYFPENNMNVRLFADYFGVPEDPATGSANGCLAGYLAKYRYWGEPKINVRVEQGYEIGRPSLLLLKAEEVGKKVRVQVGGRVIPVAEGKLF
jgi:trans-2,3-dihydro-3-hydroxyanthranilate isomerase